jgi:hypothetical protein
MEYIELNGTFYECERELAELLEYLRVNTVRVKVYKFLEPKPLVGYVTRKAHRWAKADRPLVVYNSRSKMGRWLDEAILSEIRFSNKAMGEDPIWTRRGGVQIEFETPLMQVGEQ